MENRLLSRGGCVISLSSAQKDRETPMRECPGTVGISVLIGATISGFVDYFYPKLIVYRFAGNAVGFLLGSAVVGIFAAFYGPFVQAPYFSQEK